jgi:beta-glucanase (GH16 family)
MKKLLLLLLIFTELSFGQTPGNDTHWQLIWQDDFQYFDNNKWIKANYCDHGGEPILLLEQNAYVSNGNLVFKVDNNPTYCPNNPPPVTTWACGSCNEGIHPYISGWVENTSYFNIQYGYIEARMKVPYGKGLWTAFWTFVGDGIIGNNAAEIDIAEIMGDLYSFSNLQNIPSDQITTTNIHTDYCPPICPQPDNFSPIIMMSSYTDWHKYAIEWSPSRIIWYLDDYPIRLFPNNGVVDPVRIILGIGIQNSQGIPISSLNLTSFPQYLLVDYVKVYELKKECNDYINATNYNFNLYNNYEKNFIRLGEGGGNNYLLPSDNITLRASQYIYIEGDFNVPLGASIYMDASNDCLNNIETTCTHSFNPCFYDFCNYDNLIKQTIELGGNGCNISITPCSNSLSLESSEKIHLKPGVVITPSQNKSIKLKITSCY